MINGSQDSAVCVYSFHPLVLAELERVFADDGMSPKSYRLDPSHAPAFGRLPVPPASAYVVEANSRKQALRAVVAEILSQEPRARLLLVGEHFEEEEAFEMLEFGVKGLVRYADLKQQLVPAAREVAAGGFWLSRSMLSRFVDSALRLVRRHRVVRVSSHLSRREREVHDLLLENHSNKEIAARLNMSERTVKFHVSNLLNKHGVKRRTDLIFLSLANRLPA